MTLTELLERLLLEAGRCNEVTYQVNLELASPYAVRHGLAGLEGLIELYRDYRQLTDRLYTDLDIRRSASRTQERNGRSMKRPLIPS